MNKRPLWQRLDPVNTAFLLLTPVIAVAGIAFLARYDGIRTPTLIFTVIMAIFTGFGITAGYHRLFSHKSYDAKWPFKLFMLLLGAAAFENSALKWSCDHRRHHKYVDTELDPYNIKQGFWYAHMWWVCLKSDDAVDPDNVPDLMKDKLVVWQDRFYLIIGIVMGFGFPMAVASLWGDPLGGLILPGFARIVFNHHATFAINSVCHYMGSQPYSDRDSSRDSWIPALFTYGEGYHNYHHSFPSDYRNGIRAYHWDPTKWLIRGLEWCGQTYNLRRMPADKVLAARLRMDEKRMLGKIERASAAVDMRREFVVAARVKIEEAYAHFRSLKKEYAALKAAKVQALNSQLAHLNERIAKMKQDMAGARQRFHAASEEWGRLCGRLGVQTESLIIHA